MKEKFRGSSEIPLTDAGVRGAVGMALKLAQRGGLDEIHASSLGRTVHTARIISHYTHAPLTYVGDGLHPWHLGQLEGQEVSPEHIDLLNHLITHTPDEAVPGRGPLSTADGESFNDFKHRALDYVQGVLNRLSGSDRRIGLVTHYRVKKLLESWLREGANDDHTINSDFMTLHDAKNQPGGVDRLFMDPYAGPQLSAVDLDRQMGRLLPGAYIIRHESTPWNGTQS